MYIYAESGKGLYTECEPSDFRIDLGKTIELEGKWEIALLDIDLPTLQRENTTMFLTLYSNVCTESIENGIERPILYRVFKSDFRQGKALTIATPRYVPLSQNSIRTIHIYILDHIRQKPSFRPGRTTCTLHLRKS